MTRTIDLSVPRWVQRSGAVLFVAHVTWPAIDWVMDGYLLDALGIDVASGTSIFAAYLIALGLWLLATVYFWYVDRSVEEEGWHERPPERETAGVAARDGGNREGRRPTAPAERDGPGDASWEDEREAPWEREN